jgi:hypothetical protein
MNAAGGTSTLPASFRAQALADLDRERMQNFGSATQQMSPAVKQRVQSLLGGPTGASGMFVARNPASQIDYSGLSSIPRGIAKAATMGMM